MTRYDLFNICERNDDEWHIRNIQIKIKMTIIVQYTKEYVAVVVKNHKKYNKINIDHSPSRFLLQKNQ